MNMMSPLESSAVCLSYQQVAMLWRRGAFFVFVMMKVRWVTRQAVHGVGWLWTGNTVNILIIITAA